MSLVARRPRPSAVGSMLSLAALVASAATLRAQPAGPAPAPAPAAGRIDSMALVRCVAERALPCVRVRVTPAAPGDSAAWGGRLGPYALQPVSARVALAGGPPQAVLVLVDASGSMAGEGVQAARAAVRSFLRDLGTASDSGVVRVAVAPFASRGVAAAIGAATFGTPGAVAPAIDRLQPPAGNTGLYSAVAVGAERVAAEATRLGAGARAALVVVTDGRNDVRDPAGRRAPGTTSTCSTAARGGRRRPRRRGGSAWRRTSSAWVASPTWGSCGRSPAPPGSPSARRSTRWRCRRR